jgi:Ca2+-dependent lipid-binding protein
LFNDNGQCGYVLKPSILREPLLGFNPYDLTTMKNKKLLEIKVISAQQLPPPVGTEIIKDIIDPYVLINILGVPADRSEKRTKTVKDNGFSPLWYEDFEFQVNCPELAFVKFTVKDDDVSKDDFIGEYTIRFKNMRPGN